MSFGGPGDVSSVHQELLHAAQLSQSSYTRPDDLHTKRLRRFWRRKPKKTAEIPLDAKQAERAERQRNLMNTGDPERDT